jgi:hypothetical protein
MQQYLRDGFLGRVFCSSWTDYLQNCFDLLYADLFKGYYYSKIRTSFTVVEMLEMTHIRCKDSNFIYRAKLISSSDCLMLLSFPMAFRGEA